MRVDLMLRSGSTGRRLLVVLSACIVQLMQASCILLPIPHTVVEHGTIRGRVIDDETGRPLSGVRFHIDQVDGEPFATSNTDGDFCVPEDKSWRFFCMIPLLPFDFDHSERLEVDHAAVSSSGDSARYYRPLTIGVQGHRPCLVVGDRGMENRGLEDDVGTIRLKSLPQK